ncbi:ABC transporter ATP-binding protein [Deinococcus radiotolerans]|uniref:ABC transporter ATP-binding protein n=1 Tax=Deinococcus radiotolerans TaxID=1309407 RepID=A0ABQ2FPS8_9DEIO|nr:ABC transporter ATP-binding protein [Deinococcus radiotolerans]GGL14790.1 ABC transporter ATP-binding protein [Deinococcus radiotolerans]
MNAIELSGVNKTFGRVTALRDLNLSVRAGELTALLGPNGAGKTTAINLMLGLAAPSAGQVRVLGGNPRDDVVRARIGSMPQESALPPALTVREAVTLLASFYPAPLPVAQALALADLEGVAHRRSGALSGGQKRRLAFALAAVGNPEVLLIDEPTTGMDAQSRLAFWEAVTALKAAGRTILLTTHYLEEAERAADRVVVMNAGAVLADGSPEALRSQAGGARVSFTSDLVLAELRHLPGAEDVRVDAQGHAQLRTGAPEALLRALIARDVPFSNLEVTRASLEDAFLSLTAPAGPAGKDVTA